MAPREEHGKNEIEAGLHIVATPIGNARDITLRALDVLANADILLAEDTRRLRQLMQIHGIALNQRPLWAYHEHNGMKMRPKILEALQGGARIALVSDAGTPVIADPGLPLVVAARDQGLRVISAPGPSALTAALSISGMASDRVLFAGFLPATASARKKALKELKDIQATLVFYESPKRIHGMLRDAVEVLGADRNGCICREMTKHFEDIRRGTLDSLVRDPVTEKGEFVVLIERGSSGIVLDADLDDLLRSALRTMRLRDAAESVAHETGLPRRTVYQRGLSLASEEADPID